MNKGMIILLKSEVSIIEIAIIIVIAKKVKLGVLKNRNNNLY